MRHSWDLSNEVSCTKYSTHKNYKKLAALFDLVEFPFFSWKRPTPHPRNRNLNRSKYKDQSLIHDDKIS